MKQSRYLCLMTGAALFSSALRPAHADLQTYYSFGLDGTLDGNSFSSYLSLDDNFRFNSGQARLDGENFRAAAGDLSGDFDSLSLSNRAFQGIQATVPYGRSEFTAVAGRTSMPLSLLDIVRRPVGFLDDNRFRATSSVYGLRGSYSLTPNLKINAAQLFTPDSNSLEGKTISNASLVYAPDSTRRISFEGASSKRGQGYQFSGEERTKRYLLQALFRQADREFSSAGNLNLLTNRSGHDLSGSYILSPDMTVAATTFRYTDGFGGHSRADSLALNFALRDEHHAVGPVPHVSLTYQNRELQNSQITNGEDQKLRGPGIHFNTESKGISYLAGYDKLDLRSGTTRNNIGRFTLSAGKRLSKTSYLLLFGSLDNETKNTLSGRAHSLVTSVNYNRSFSHNTFTLQTGLERRHDTADDIRGTQGTSYALRFGLSIPVGHSDRTVGFDYRRQLSATGDIAGAFGDVLYLSYRQSISIGRAPSQFATNRISDDARKQLGQITAHIYEDLNLNGKRDPGEPGVPGVLLGITDDVRAQTDKNGDAHFVNLPPNAYNVRLVVPSLPIELTILDGIQHSANLGARQSLNFEFPVSHTGEISGTVYRDLNSNGKRDEGEDGLENALVRIDGTEIIGFSGPDGHFTLTNVPPGKPKLTIDTEFLSDGAKTFSATTPPVTLDLSPGAKVEAGELGVATAEAPIVIGELPPIAAQPEPVKGVETAPATSSPVAGDGPAPPTIQPIALRK